MQHRFVSAVLFAALSCASTVFGFNPPTDKQGDVTLSIEGFPETSTKEHLSLRKVSTDQPLAFTVTLRNARTQPVSGTLRLWLNDDWDVIGTNAMAVQAEPGKTLSFSCTAKARDRVLSALYPIHAELALTLDGQPVDLHPIAIFEAVRPASAKPILQKETVASDGILRLDCGADRRVFYRQNGGAVELGVNFSGSDPASGAHFTREPGTARGGVTRAGFGIHPPYRGAAGVTWSDFRLALPAGKPASLNFYTSLRDSSPTEPLSDGTEFKVIVRTADGAEKELFSRFSACKTWEPARVDLSAYAGRHITLRLWTGPGPKNNTTCDQCYWGDPIIAVGTLPAIPTEAQWLTRERDAVARARAARVRAPASDSGAFRLESDGQRFGAAVVLGDQGLTDGVLAFSDGTRELVYRGFACDIDRSAVGGVENGQPVQKVETAAKNGAWIVTHRIARSDGPVTARATVSAKDGALRIAWDMPGVVRDLRGTPRFTRLCLGAGDAPVWRAYAGFGNVIENPGALDLNGGGFGLSTRHVGADYTNGLSLVQACDVFPDRLVYAPETRRFSLETAHDATFLLIPSARGAFAAARVYSGLSGFGKGRGVDTLKGRVCFDQWGGDYLQAAADLNQAAQYGLNHAIFVKHAWQRWGYDYRLPNIYPPADGLEPFLAMRTAAEKAGILFCPHDNYIDFYPDADGYSYDRIVFHENGQPMKAWYNKGRRAQSYRWLPHGFRPWLESNMRHMHDGFHPDSLFIDVFTAIAPFDYYDRDGAFYPRTLTIKKWREAFDTCRAMLKSGAPMISEAGADSLIGSIDAGEADHFTAKRWMKEFGDSERTPWHDMATHGKMVLLAGGLGNRYSAEDWADHGGSPQHNYGSDDYLSNTVIGGRNPMCDGPFSRRAVMTYWLLHDVCDALAHATLETHAFGATIHQQHTTFSGGGRVWTNRGTNQVWTVADGRILPHYGFYAVTPEAEAGIVQIDGQRAGFAKAKGVFFADARPVFHSLHRVSVESAATSGKYLGNGVFEVAFHWQVLEPVSGYVPFVHICSDTQKTGNAEHISFQTDMPTVAGKLGQTGEFTTTARIAVPKDLSAGAYRIRYGLYRQGKGDRLAIRGLTDGGQRIRGGVMTVEKSGASFGAGSFALEGESDEDATSGLNVAKKMLDFGPLVTDGAFRLTHPDGGFWSFVSGRPAWQLIPLPGSDPFRAEIRLDAFGAKGAAVKTVEKVNADCAGAKEPEWSQTGSTLRVACDGQSFAYRIEFK